MKIKKKKKKKKKRKKKKKKKNIAAIIFVPKITTGFKNALEEKLLRKNCASESPKNETASESGII